MDCENERQSVLTVKSPLSLQQRILLDLTVRSANTSIDLKGVEINICIGQ